MISRNDGTGEYCYMNYLLVQFLIELDGTLRNGNQLELALKY
jgi:hypothetical protein